MTDQLKIPVIPDRTPPALAVAASAEARSDNAHALNVDVLSHPPEATPPMVNVGMPDQRVLDDPASPPPPTEVGKAADAGLPSFAETGAALAASAIEDRCPVGVDWSKVPVLEFLRQGLEPSQRRDYIDKLKLLPADQIGRDPRRLLFLVEQAAMPMVLSAGEGPWADFGEQHRAGQAGASELVAPFLKKLIEASKLADPAALGTEGRATDRHPWLAKIDHVAAAASGLGISIDNAVVLAEAARMIATLEMAPKPKGKPGSRPEMDLARAIARATVVYRHQMGLSYNFAWKSVRASDALSGSARGDDEVIPVSDTARLICAVAKILGVAASHAQLMKRHQKYLGILKAAGRSPSPSDLIDIDFVG